jgi:hypothetical protein
MRGRREGRATRPLIGGALLLLATVGALTFSAAAWVPTDANAGSAFATSHFFPSSTLTPTVGVSGSTISVSGSGFAPNSNLTVRFNGTGTAWTSGGGTVTTDGTGAIPALSTIAAGNPGPGTYPVRVTDAQGDYATATFQLLN